MIRLQPISTSDLQHYKFMEELLIDSFPPEEYRQLEQLREYTDRTGNFHNNIIFDDDLPFSAISFIIYEKVFGLDHPFDFRFFQDIFDFRRFLGKSF